MKKIIVMLAVCFSISLLTRAAQAELPPKVEGENFQRVERLIDCQQVWIPEFKGIHPEIKKTACFYNIFIVKSKRDGDAITREHTPLVMYVETNNLTGEVSTGYLSASEQK